jgi:hypothetical protein
MFWISYCVTFVLASAAAIVLMAIRIVLSAVARGFGLAPTLNHGKAVRNALSTTAGADVIASAAKTKGLGIPSF